MVTPNWFGGMYVCGPPGEGKSVLINWYGLRWLRDGGVWVCNNTPDRLQLYTELRRHFGKTHLEARDAAEKRVRLWKSYDDITVYNVEWQKRKDTDPEKRGVLLTLDEAKGEFGKKQKLGHAISQTFSQCRKFGISFICGSQGDDDVSEDVLNMCHVHWEAFRWSKLWWVDMGLGAPVDIASRLLKKGTRPVVFRYQKTKINGHSTYALKRDRFASQMHALTSVIMPRVSELKCFNSWEKISSAETDRLDAERNLAELKRLAKGETVPVKSCLECEGTGKCLWIANPLLADSVLRIDAEALLTMPRWVTRPNSDVFRVLEQGIRYQHRPCESCDARGYREVLDDPAVQLAREKAREYGWR